MFYSIVLSITLALDAFASAVSLGLSQTVKNQKDKLKVSISFGFFQFIMPVIGGLVISPFTSKYEIVIKVLGTVFLTFLGGKMVYESFQPSPNLCEKVMCDDSCNEKVCKRTGKERQLSNKKLIQYSVATSIDALLAGVVITSLGLDFLITVVLIGVITFALSYIGINFGRFVKNNMEKRFEFIGGVILILLAIKTIM